MASQIQIKLITKQMKYAVPDNPLFVPVSVTSVQLTSMVKSMLKESGAEKLKQVKFDFLVFDTLLRLSLEEHLESKNISTDSVIEIEYFSKLQPPTPENSLEHDDWVGGVAVEENWILSGCYDNTVHVWSIGGIHKASSPGHGNFVRSVAWIEVGYPQSTFVSTSEDSTVRLWQWNQKANAIKCIEICQGHDRQVYCVDVNKEQHKFATSGADKIVNIWSSDLPDASEKDSGSAPKPKKRRTESSKTIKTPLMSFSGHTDSVHGIQWLNSNELCTVSWDNTIKIWDVEQKGLKSQVDDTRAFLDVSYSPINGMLLTGSCNHLVRLWDHRVKDGSALKSLFYAHSDWIYSVKWSPLDPCKFVSCSADKMIKLWDTRSTKSPLYDLLGHSDKVFSVDWSKENFIVSGSADKQVKVFKGQQAAARKDENEP